MRADPYTGEFLVPGDPRFTVDLAQHMVPYVFCAERVAGLRVAEIGCGAGYGAAHLAGAAREVHAFDRNRGAIAYARSHYRAANLSFHVEGDGLEPEPHAYDVVCSFQVLEHVRRPAPFVRRLALLLTESGTLYLTTPNRLTSAGENIYHVHEYEPVELTRLLSTRFPRVSVLGITGSARFRAYQEERRRAMGSFLRLDPLRLRRLIPRRWLAAPYAAFSRRVRRRIGSAAGPSAFAIDPGDFRVDDVAVERADDLFAICSSTAEDRG